MAGVNIQKVIGNSHEMFSLFVGILKTNKKPDGMGDPKIDSMCSQFESLLLLWDGAFSVAIKTDPIPANVVLY